MADYYPVLTRAVGGLETNTAETRRAVYERARQAIVKQLRSYDPPLTESEITKERLNLEEAVRRIEAEQRAAQNGKAAAAAAGAPPPGPASFTAPPPMAPSAHRPPMPPPPPRPAVPPPPQAPRMGGEGLQQVHAAAAAAASLGAATANAQASANTTRAAFDGAPPAPGAATSSARVEPNFERPRVPGPLPTGRPDFSGDRLDDLGDPNPHLREPDQDDAPPRRAGAGSLIAVLFLLGLCAAGYFMRGEIAALFNGGGETISASDGPKVADRVAETDAVPGTIARDTAAPGDIAAVTPEPAPSASGPSISEPAATQPPAAPTTPPSLGGLVQQRAILYDEAPDRQGGQASNGAVVWRTEPVENNPSETKLVGEISVPDRNIKATITLTRNLDTTLPASHVIEVGFTVPPDFGNGGIGNVPGILFKESEEAGGSPLKGMSVKVTKNVFWIGLESAPADRAQNLRAIRANGWIDIPILYDNGRRAVMTLEKGTPGEQAFAAAFAAWDAAPAAAVPQ